MKKVYENPILNIELLEEKNIFLLASGEEGSANTASYNELF